MFFIVRILFEYQETVLNNHFQISSFFVPKSPDDLQKTPKKHRGTPQPPAVKSPCQVIAISHTLCYTEINYFVCGHRSGRKNEEHKDWQKISDFLCGDTPFDDVGNGPQHHQACELQPADRGFL